MFNKQPKREPIPPDRSYESVLHHFNVERKIAARLKAADREGRKAIYRTMYDELFAEVPDHPRLTRRDTLVLTEKANRNKMRKVRPFVNGSTVYLEFGSGDCRFPMELAKHVKFVYAVDIADQIGKNFVRPENFKLIVYNGYDLDLPSDSIDTVSSTGMIEHLHPEDTGHHLELIWRILRPGGVYIFRTPHAFTGPCDISRYFSDEAEGFHLKEWTTGELYKLMKSIGYRTIKAYHPTPGAFLRFPMSYFLVSEILLKRIPPHYRRRLARYFLREIIMAAYK